MRVDVRPKLLRWACQRAECDLDALVHRFPKLPEWESGKVRPTLKQLEDFAKATHTPIGFLFLKEPPKEHVPIPDLRTVGNKHIRHPSPNLLDTIYVCQQRQEWYRDFARMMGEKPLPFVGSKKIGDNIKQTAEDIRNALGFNPNNSRTVPTWSDALRHFIERADNLGILVMVNGIVGTNTRRKLNSKEFRGFALSDNLAPLVFINGKDSKAAQIFTLAHELVHIWLGESALSDVGPNTSPSHDVEIWCNQVAAELLVPVSLIKAEYQTHEE